MTSAPEPPGSADRLPLATCSPASAGGSGNHSPDRRRGFVSGRRSCGFASFLVAVLAISALADWMWVLPRPVRSAGAATALGCCDLVRGAAGRGTIGNQVAAAVEQRVPGAGSASSHGRRIRRALAGNRAGVSGHGQGLAPPGRRSNHRIGLSAGGSLARTPEEVWSSWGWHFSRWALGLVFRPDLRTAVLRALLVPASYTTLRWSRATPRSVPVRSGCGCDPRRADRSARCDGSTAAADRQDTGRRRTWHRPGGRARRRGGRSIGRVIAGHLADCHSDLEYRVEAGELESPVYRVRVIQPLTIARFEATAMPPSYTRRPPAVQTTAISGSSRDRACNSRSS